MKLRSHIPQKERKELKLSDFLGVDFSSSPYRVAKNRATNMRNLINEYGINHKRPGWREIKSFKAYDESDISCAVNGIFKYNHGNHSVIIIHAGEKMYRIENTEDSLTNINLHECISGSMALRDVRSQAFYSRGRLYIVGCGDYLVYGTWDGGASYELRRVYADTDTYIPTTTISIDNDANESDLVRATLDQLNRLTPLRRNKLLGASIDDTVTCRSWKLDAESIDAGTDVTLAVEVMREETLTALQISNFGEDKTILYDEDGAAVGSIDYGVARITLTVDTTPPIEGGDNITVTFSATVTDSNTLKHCAFGTLFGADGYTDRLFLSGNPDYPNADFFSEPDDYTYFPERNFCTVGSDASAIVGYIRLADSTLAVFKEEYLSEPSLYYRTGTTQTEYDAGVISDMYGIFPSVAGSIGESLVSRYALANFGDDALMLSRSGVYGIIIGTNASTTERYTRERSRRINERLRRQALDEAVGIVYRNKYYLAVDDCCYIADARFLSNGDNLDGAYNYEWWYWDNIPARVFAVIDDKLYFGTPDGKLCVFDSEYSDRTYYVCEEGDIAYNTDNGTVAYREGLEIAEGDGIIFDEAFYVKFASGSVEDSRISFEQELADEVYNGALVYIESIDAVPAESNTKYYVTDVDKNALTYRLIDADGNDVELDASEISLCRNLQGKQLYISDIDTAAQEFCVKEFSDGVTLRLVSGARNAVTQPSAVITYSKNVVAEWYSPILDMGANDMSKTLLRMTLCAEPGMAGNLTFGYEVRAVSNMMSSKGYSDLGVFSFEELSFESFTFDMGHASSYTVRLNERNFNFIVFRYISDGATDCAVNDITAVYKFNKLNIGVR